MKEHLSNMPKKERLKGKTATGKLVVSEYTFVAQDGDEIIVRDEDTGKLELWGRTDHGNSSFVIYYDNFPYEFISSSNIKSLLNTIKEMTTTGNVAGYSTPYAFSKRGDGNRKAAETVGYELVKKEVKEPSLLENKYLNYKKYPSKSSTKMSMSLKEINSMLRTAAKLLTYNLKLKNEVGLDGNFWKRSSADVSAIMENIKSLSRGVKILTRGKLNEATEVEQPVVTTGYQISVDFDAFEKSIVKLVTKFQQIIEDKVKGKTVVLRASKGIGQVEKEYEFSVSSVSLTMFKEKYNIIFRGSNKKEYYVNPSFPVKIKGTSAVDSEPVRFPVSTTPLPVPQNPKQVTK